MTLEVEVGPWVDERFPEGADFVKKWLVQVSNYKKEGRRFAQWMRYVKQSQTDFAHYTPDQLIEFQGNTDNGSRYKILDDIVKPYIRGQAWRYHTKRRMYATIKGFFLYSRNELPRDKTFNIRGDKATIVGDLSVDEIKNMVLASKPRYQAIFLCMFQSGMGQDEFTWWNENGWDELKAQLDEGEVPIRITLPGRKKNKFEKPYYSYLGKDAVEALRRYVKIRPNKNKDGKVLTSIFLSRFTESISKNSIYQYWLRNARKIGIYPPSVTKKEGGLRERTGKGPHEMRDTFRSLWTKSGRSPVCAEFLMGHIGDKLGYDKASNDKDWTRREYLHASKFLNIMSSDVPFGKVGQDVVEQQDARIAELEARLERSTRELYLERVEAQRDLAEHQEDISRVKTELKRLFAEVEILKDKPAHAAEI